MNTKPPPLHIANCDEKIKNFIMGIIALFCDPRNKNTVAMLKDGEMAIQMHPHTGHAHVFSLKNSILTPNQRN